MRAAALTIAGMVVSAGLAGCQEQRTVVLEQASSASLAASGVPAREPAAGNARPASPNLASPNLASPCRAPWGTGPFEPLTHPVSSGKWVAPARAQAEHVSGCAGIRFRTGPDGTPQDIEVLADYPAGYGFGEAGRKVVAETRWAARDDLAWHYLVLNQHP